MCVSPRLLAAVGMFIVAVSGVSCQNSKAGGAIVSVLDEMVTVNGQPFSKGMAQVTGSVKSNAGFSNDSRRSSNSSEQPSRSPEEEAERRKLLAELGKFRSNLSVGDTVRYYEHIWQKQEILAIQPNEVSVKWNSSFRSANRVSMSKVFPGYWETSTIKKTFDVPNIARATIEHRENQSSEDALDANYDRWKIAKAESEREKSTYVNTRDERDRSTKTLYRCKKCGQEENKTGKYQDLTPGGTCPAEDLWIFGHNWEKVGRFEVD